MNEEIKYLTLKQLADCSRYPFTVGQIKGIFFRRTRNGLDKFVRKIGRTLYIRQDNFEKWIENQKDQRCKI